VSSATTLFLIRHGEVRNPDGIFYGRLPRFPLNKNGYYDAVRAADFFKSIPVAAIYSSPLLRARQTAEIIQRHHPQLKVSHSRYLIEVKSGFEGKKESEIIQAGNDVYFHKESTYEQPPEVFSRVQAFFSKVKKKHAGQHVIAITHGDLILFTLFWFNNIEITAANKCNLSHFKCIAEYPATGSITSIKLLSTDEEGNVVHSYMNDGIRKESRLCEKLPHN